MSNKPNSLEDLFANALLKESASKLQEVVKDKIENIQTDLLERVSKLSERVDSKIDILESKIVNTPLTVNIGTIEKPKNILTHKCFDTVIKVLQSAKRINKNITLVGPAASGKSSLCSQIAETLKLQFYPMSVGLQTTKSDLLGFINAKGDYITTPVRQAYENGGVLLLDEFDATHAGVVTILNSMLANDFCSFPDKIVNKHKDFVCFVACNTYGKGGSIDYIGRNRLDGATLDRFICIEVDYDSTLESSLTNNSEWLNVINKMRRNINEFGLKVIISPKASMQGADLLEAGFPIEEVLDMCIYKGLNSDTKNKLIKDIDLGIFNKSKTLKSNNNNTKKSSSLHNNRRIEVEIDFDAGIYSVKGISEDIIIEKDVDWDSRYTIYISSGNNWCAGLHNRDLYLNHGKNLYFSNGLPKTDDILQFINELEVHSSEVKLDGEDSISFAISYRGIQRVFYIG